MLSKVKYSALFFKKLAVLQTRIKLYKLNINLEQKDKLIQKLL